MPKIRFSIQALLAIVLVASIMLAATTQWRYSGRVRTQFLDPASAQALSLLATSKLVLDGDPPTAEYISNYQNVHRLFSIAEDAIELQGGLRADFDNDRLVLQTSSPNDMQQIIDIMRKNDVLGQKDVVVRGILLDPLRQPISGMPVDLMGPLSKVNHCRTRSDGTFSLPAKLQTGNDYSLRFRRSFAETFTSMPFAINPKKREIVVQVTIPVVDTRK